MNKEILEKVALFNDLAMRVVSDLQAKLDNLEKEAKLQESKKEQFEDLVKKAADSLYDADFLSDRFAYKEFVKKASSDPGCLVKTIEKICAHKDVLGLGKVSSVTSSKQENFDPIYAKAFGCSNQMYDLLED